MNSLLAPDADAVRSARGLDTWLDRSIGASVGLWALSRLLVIAAAVRWDGLLSDVRYWTGAMDSGVGPHQALAEYPVPAYVLLWIPWVVAHSLGTIPGPVYLLAALMADAALHIALIRHGRGVGRVTAAEWLWIAAGPALGAVAIAHFDVVVGVLVGVALLQATAHPRRAVTLVALAVGLKYTPIVALPGLLARGRWRIRLVSPVVVTGLALTSGSVLIAGPARLTSPLVWQSERGLEVESVAATPVMVARAWAPDSYHVALSAHLSFDITGPGVALATGVTGVALGVLMVVCALLWWRTRGGVTTDAMVWLVIAPTMGFVACNKVFSPQYLLWATPVAAAGLAIVSPAEGRRLSRWAAGLVACCALTQLGPVLDLGGLVMADQATELPVVMLLALRNLGVVVLAVSALIRAYALTAPTATNLASTSSAGH